jgi:hypothetical protein
VQTRKGFLATLHFQLKRLMEMACASYGRILDCPLGERLVHTFARASTR